MCIFLILLSRISSYQIFSSQDLKHGMEISYRKIQICVELIEKWVNRIRLNVTFVKGNNHLLHMFRSCDKYKHLVSRSQKSVRFQ